ncbi:MAG: LPS export ABC transporter permease LptF [Rhodoferax sp.]
MLFQSALRKELSRSFSATLIVLVTVVMTMTLIRTLGQAARGSFSPSDVTLIMGFTVLAYTPTLLSLALFIGIMAVLSRMYRDSEMVIWLTAGQGIWALLGPLLRFAWPVLAAVAALALAALPWTNQQIDTLKTRFEQRGDLDRIEPGQFQESANGERVFFIESNVERQNASNVFIVTTEGRRQIITSARRGHIEDRNDGRYLVLQDGQRLELERDTRAIKVSEFQSYSARIGAAPPGSASPPAINTINSWALMRLGETVPAARAELSWRLGLPVSALNLVFVALALAKVNPRAHHKSLNVVFAVLTFVVYFNLLNLGQSWIAGDRVRVLTYFGVLHGGVAGLALLWVWVRSRNLHWRDVLRVFPRTMGERT